MLVELSSYFSVGDELMIFLVISVLLVVLLYYLGIGVELSVLGLLGIMGEILLCIMEIFYVVGDVLVVRWLYLPIDNVATGNTFEAAAAGELFLRDMIPRFDVPHTVG